MFAARTHDAVSNVAYLARHPLAASHNFERMQRARLQWALPMAVAAFCTLTLLLVLAMLFDRGGSPAPFMGP